MHWLLPPYSAASCSQPIYRKSFTLLLKVAAFLLQPEVMNVDIFSNKKIDRYFLSKMEISQPEKVAWSRVAWTTYA